MPADASNTTYGRLASILERYVSRIMVRSVLDKALIHCDVESTRLGPEHVVAVVENAMTGLRLFCSPAQLPDLMLELAEFCDRETSGKRPSQF